MVAYERVCQAHLPQIKQALGIASVKTDLFLLLYRFPEALLNTMTKTFILRPNSQGGLGLSPIKNTA